MVWHEHAGQRDEVPLSSRPSDLGGDDANHTRSDEELIAAVSAECERVGIRSAIVEAFQASRPCHVPLGQQEVCLALVARGSLPELKFGPTYRCPN